MKKIFRQKIGYLVAASISMSALLVLPAGAAPAASTGVAHNTDTASNKAAAQAADQQARLQKIISRGNTEINRRLTTLKTLDSKISAATKLTTADAALLSSTVNSDTTALTALETKLDNETTVTAAIADAQSIFSDYRVYALVVPQVHLVKTADDQQVTEAKIASFGTKLSTRITAAQTAGKNVTALLASLSDLSSKVAAAQAISSSMEAAVIPLVPSDYNSNHSLLSGDRSQLQTAQSDIRAAVADARSIVSGLRSL